MNADTTYYARWETVPEDWDYNATTGGMSKTFTYTGAVQTFQTLVSGSYTFELHGAGGGNGRNGGSKGGLAKGTITHLASATKLSAYIGEKGKDGDAAFGGGGGGATEIWFDQYGADYRVIIAGGGGGGYNAGNSGGGGGSAGGSKGGSGKDYNGGGGYRFGTYSIDSDGVGGGGGDDGHFGGGGGGGGNDGGGGGSSFVNDTGENPIPGSTASAFSVYKFTSNLECAAGAGSSGNGSATVTYKP
ncbi:MAG: hypothetical protein LBJ35_03855 [Spirochaetaceae bacterium]|nr:hypothetical protein [Spirochaetaceae bacterium]